MKKGTKIGLGITIAFGALAVISVCSTYLLWDQITGAWTALSAPTEDVTEAIPSTNAAPELEPPITQEEEVTTELPLVKNGAFYLPADFDITIFVEDLSDARDMVQDGMGNIWVSRPDAGVITQLVLDEAGNVTETIDIFRDLRKPHGLAMDPDDGFMLYFAEEDAVYRVPLYTEASPEKIVDLPTGGRHSTRDLEFGPNGLLYISIGSSCDVCEEPDPRQGTVQQIGKDGENLRYYSAGLRNAVFMTVHPNTGDIWVSEMGRDFLGDDLPPDEINILQPQAHFGWPYCYGNNIRDEKFEGKEAFDCNTAIPSTIDLQAHSAPLGLGFVPEGNGWPEEYENDLIVAYHGSWNRTVPTGYKLVRFDLDEKGNPAYLEYKALDFVTGWLKEDGGTLGRPSGILFVDDYLLVADDASGVIYKIQYED